jgi:DNA helicase II / ATP-dependent DNA helicase PcrA
MADQANNLTVPDFLAEGNPEPTAVDPLLDGLTEDQRTAVAHRAGPALVLAAAGSGKTRVITRRIAKLVHDGEPAWSILALTFTNKAAAEMRERAGQLLPGRTRGLTVSTFHALCARLLRRYAEAAGLKPDYAIYDTQDQLAVVKRAIKNAGLSTSNWSPRSVLSGISNAKNALMDAKGFEASAGDFYQRTIAKIYSGYEKALRRAGAVDFDDLLLLTVRALRTDQNARRECVDRWRWLMIDEYQDTNAAQFELARLLCAGANRDGGPPNIMVVGDPDQSIYGWRGADITNILEFEEAFLGARVITLGENFRSTAPILGVADALIKNNLKRKDKPLYTTREGGERVEVAKCREERHEAEVVSRWLAEQRERGLSWKEMAVFYRVNSLSRVMEDALRAAGTPYTIARGTAFYDREEVRDALAYLRVLANPADDVSLRRIVNKPARGLGKTSLARVEALASERDIPLFDALREAAGGSLEGEITGRSQGAMGKFVALVDSWREGCTLMGVETAGSLQELVERVVRESGLENHYGKKTLQSGEPDTDRLENLAELISSAHDFDMEYVPEADAAVEIVAEAEGESASAEAPPLLAMLRAYLESVALVADADAVDPAQGAVTLMTLHASKGLEFKAVAMIGLEEGLLPHSRASESDAELEEERRLCFVGVTRAMERLLITSAAYRTHRGMMDRTIGSRFLEELPEAHVTFTDTTAAADRGSATIDDYSESYEPAPDESDDLGGLREGIMVRHPRFGVGRVDAILSKGTNPRVRIAFTQAGLKTIVLGYAPLVPLE